jgi:hypothetical protein
MKRSYCLALLAAMVVPSSGCSLIDRLFLANCDGPYVHQADHINGHVHDGAMYDGETVYEGAAGDGAIYEGDASGAMYDQGACRDGRCQGGGHCRNGLCHGVRCQEGVCPGGVCQTRCQSGHCGKCHHCNHCRHLGRYGGLARHHLSQAEQDALAGSDYGATGPAGPPGATVAYPYYTTRGPRDFLSRCPPSVGP